MTNRTSPLTLMTIVSPLGKSVWMPEISTF